jgi:hypothetical protein
VRVSGEPRNPRRLSAAYFFVFKNFLFRKIHCARVRRGPPKKRVFFQTVRKAKIHRRSQRRKRRRPFRHHGQRAALHQNVFDDDRKAVLLRLVRLPNFQPRPQEPLSLRPKPHQQIVFPPPRTRDRANRPKQFFHPLLINLKKVRAVPPLKPNSREPKPNLAEPTPERRTATKRTAPKRIAQKRTNSKRTAYSRIAPKRTNPQRKTRKRIARKRRRNTVTPKTGRLQKKSTARFF